MREVHALDALGRLEPHQATQRREDVHCAQGSVGAEVGRDTPWPAQQEGNATRLFVKDVLRPPTVRAEHLAVVRGEDQDGVPLHLEIRKCFHETPEVPVEARDLSVVVATPAR